MGDVEERRVFPGMQMRIDDAQVVVLYGQHESAEIHHFSTPFHVEIVQGRNLRLGVAREQPAPKRAFPHVHQPPGQHFQQRH